MRIKEIVYLFIIGFVVFSCKKENTSSEKEILTDANGFKYETFENDPTGLRLYTLDNGLKVYLSQNTDEPKIQTFMRVRAGSVYYSSDNTGLAHSLEHIVFKGTDVIWTQNWEEEKKYLDQISALYEEHKSEQDPDKKKNIYK